MFLLHWLKRADCAVTPGRGGQRRLPAIGHR